MTSIVTRLRSLPPTDFNGLAAISAVQEAADLIESLTSALEAMLPENNTDEKHCRPDFETCEKARAALARAKASLEDHHG